jgi:uncharacterized membrane protein YfcA
LEILGFVLAVFIGVSLGLMGGGGSILTVPLLVYFFHVNTFIASSYSLIIVGISSFIGAIPFVRKGQFHFPAIIQVGLPSVISVYLTKYFLIPLIPNQFSISSGFVFYSDRLLLVFFSLLLFFAAFAMIRNVPKQEERKNISGFKLILYGILTGFLTGLVGVGGGFIIIPVLVLVCDIPMKKAVGSSLIIIVLNSIIGILAVRNFADFDQVLLLKISLLSIIGIVIGSLLAKKIDGNKLKKVFGWFIFLIGMGIFIKEISAYF